MTLTGAGADDMAVEAVGDTAVRRGDDAEAGARMDCDDVGAEGGAPRVTVPQVTVTFDAGNDEIEVEDAEANANRRENNVAAGARLDCDQRVRDPDCDAPGTAGDKSHSKGLMPSETIKKKRRRGSAKNSAGHVGGSHAHSRHQRHLKFLSKP